MNALCRFAWFSLGLLAGLFGVAVVAGAAVLTRADVGRTVISSSATVLLAAAVGLVAVSLAVQVVRLVHLPHPGRVWLGAFGVFASALGRLLASGVTEAELSGTVYGWAVALAVSKGGSVIAGPAFVVLVTVLVLAAIYAASRYASEYRKVESATEPREMPNPKQPIRNCRRWFAALVRFVCRVCRWFRPQ